MQLLADLRKVGVTSSILTRMESTHGPHVQVNCASEIEARDVGFRYSTAPPEALKPHHGIPVGRAVERFNRVQQTSDKVGVNALVNISAGDQGVLSS